MLKLLVPFVVLLAVLGVFVLTDEPQRPADFSFINRGDVSTLDLQRMSWMQDLRVARILFEGLVRNDTFSPDYKDVPAAAERWKISPDGLTYTFYLRKNAKWSNGQPVTAGDFVYSWRRGIMPDTVSDYAAQFQLIEGAEQFYAWRERVLRVLTALDSLRNNKIKALTVEEKESGPAAQTLADLIWYFLEERPAKMKDKPEGGLAMLRWQVDYAIAYPALKLPAASEDHPAGSETEKPSAGFMREHWRQTAETFRQLSSEIEELRTRLIQMPAEVVDKEGTRLWAETEQVFDSTVKLKASNDHELTVTLVRPTPYFLDLCSFAVFYPVYPPLVRQYELPNPRTGRLDLQQGWTRPPLIVSNGPFELKLWRFKRDMRMEKNPHYWNKDAINIDSILILSVEDPNAQVLTYDSGSVDWISDVTPSYRADMLADKQKFYKEHQAEYDAMVADGLDPIEIDRRLPPDPRKRISAFPAFGTYFYNFNCLPKLPDGRENPFADLKVRRAFAMAIDREHIARDVRRVGELPTSILVPPHSIRGYPQVAGLKYDPAAARALLAEAGYPGGKGMTTVEILYNKDSGHDVIAQAVARDWQENLGVHVSLANKEIKVFKDDLKNHNFMVSRAGWYGDYGDPTTFLDLNRTGDGNNDRAYSSKAYDTLLDLANNEADAAKRLEILSRAERIIVEEDLPLIPIFNYVNVYMFDPNKFTGISSHPRQEQNMYLIDMFGDGKGTDVPRALPPAPREAPVAPTVGGEIDLHVSRGGLLRATDRCFERSVCCAYDDSKTPTVHSHGRWHVILAEAVSHGSKP